jgi:hypothetical protein
VRNELEVRRSFHERQLELLVPDRSQTVLPSAGVPRLRLQITRQSGAVLLELVSDIDEREVVAEVFAVLGGDLSRNGKLRKRRGERLPDHTRD